MNNQLEGDDVVIVDLKEKANIFIVTDLEEEVVLTFN